MSAVKILVTGSEGQLGSELRAIQLQYPTLEFIFADHSLLPIEDANSVDTFFAMHKFTHCINCAAYTAVDKAEEDLYQAFLINAAATKILAVACSRNNVILFHISTDYVFNGNGKSPYRESDETDPVNLYGQSKLQGEKLALQYNENTLIFRTSWLYSSFGKNFVKTMIRLMTEKQNIGVVADQLGCPTYARDLAHVILKIISEHARPKPGIYHYCNKGIINWFQFASAIKEITGSPCNVNPIHTSEYPMPAKRPAYSALATNKIQSQFGIEIPHWEESLKICIATMRS